MNIYDIEGNVLMQAEITSSAVRYQEMSKSDYISLSWTSAQKVILPVGAYIEHTYKIDSVREVTRQFLLLETYEPTQSDEMSWKYTPEFQHPMMLLSKIPFYIKTKNSQNEDIKQHVWSFVGTMNTIAGEIEDFLNKEIAFGQAGWVVQYDSSNANTVNVSFSENDFISALTAIVNAIGDNCEWHIDYDNEVVYIGKIQRDDLHSVTLKVGENIGAPSITSSKESYYNNFAIFGGTRNITQVNNKGENISSSDIRLQLSEGSGTIEIDGKTVAYTIDEYSTLDLRKSKNEPLFTKVLDFSQIFPSLNTYVYNVRGREKYVLDEDNKKIPLTYNTDGSVATYKTFTVWYMRLAYPTTEEVSGKTLINKTVDDGVTHYWYDFEVTDDMLVNNKNIGCSFEANFNTDALTTPLAGRGTNGDYVGFELTYHKVSSSSTASDDVSSQNFNILAGDYEIIYQEDDDLIIPTNAKEMLIPRGESLPSLKCNITVLYNIAMADIIYYKDAQKRLLNTAIEEIKRLQSDLNNYAVKSYPQVFEEQNPWLQIGQPIVYDDGNGYTLNTRVLKLETNIDYNFVQQITVGNQAIKGTITQLKEDVASIIASGSNSGSGGYTGAQLTNLIGRYGIKYFLSKTSDDTAQGVITFLQGLKVGDTGNNEITSEGLARLYAYMTYGFQSGLYGEGASIDHKGNAELNSLFVRQFISTPKFVFNEISVTKAEQWNTNGYGTIESVNTENQQITLKLEANDYGSLCVGDICRGIFADIDNAYGSDSNTEGATDESGFTVHKGFFTAYFYVKRIVANEKGKFVFEYGKKATATPDPCAYMDFAQYGSFTDEQRRSSMYFSSRGHSYIEVLDGVNTWDVKPENRVARYGYLGGLSIKKKDGTYIYPEGNGIFAQDNVYFGGTVQFVQGIAGLDDLVAENLGYDVSLSQYQSVLTVDDMGNVIGGLYTEDEAQTTKQYKVATAVFVRKGQDILLEEDDASEDVTEGHYRVHAVSNECTVKIENSTVFVTAINNIKDGVAGSADDSSFDYDTMRKMTDCMVTLVVDLEGKTSKTVQMPIRIQHDQLPFMVCDLSNENASVMWNTKAAKYIGFPVETKVSLYYQNTPYDISDIDITVPTGLKASMNICGKAKTITVETDGITADSLPTVMKLPITVTGKYAGASYEYTKELTIVKSADTVVYEVVPSVDSVAVDKDGNMSQSSVSCKVYATSSDDKRYELTALPSGFVLKYAYGDTPSTAIAVGGSVAVSASNSMVTFGLYNASGTELDKESVPVVKDGKYAPKASSDDDIITVPTDSNGNALDAFSETITLSMTAGGLACTVVGVEVTKNGLTNATCTISGSKATIACAKGAALGKAGQTLVFMVVGVKGNVAYTDYVTVKLVPNVTGEDGDGYEYVYYRSSSSSAPSAPSRSGGSLTSGWQDDPMSPTDDYQYVYVAYKTGVIGSDGAFSTPTLFAYKAQDGKKGDPGDTGNGISSITTYYLISSASSGVTTSTSGWSINSIKPTESQPYLWSYTKTIYTDGSGKSTNPVIVGNYAKKGDTGNGISSITTYYLISSASSGVTTSTSGWSTATTKPTSGQPYLWSYTKTVYTDGGTYLTTPVVVGNYAKDGESITGATGARGPIPRTHTGITKGDYYMSGAKDEAYVDLVYYNNAWYRCTTTHTATSATMDTSKWEKSQTSGWTFMATDLLLADNAQIKMGSSQRIDIVDDNSNVVGSFRRPSGQQNDTTDGKWGLWLGSSNNAASAPFRVDTSGNLYATNAVISGSVRSNYATVSAGGELSKIDNINVGTGGSDWVNMFKLSWTSDMIGRTIRITNNTSAAVSITSPSGYYFCVDGTSIRSIYIMPYSCVILHGYGKDSTFVRWVVENRYRFGLDNISGGGVEPIRSCHMPVLSRGCVMVTYSNGWHLDITQTTPSGKITVSRLSQGCYRLLLPTSWSSYLKRVYSNLYEQLLVMATAYGDGVYDGTTWCTAPGKATVKMIGWTDSTKAQAYVDIWTSDDTTTNDCSFAYAIYLMGYDDAISI